ncbi:hypothetical protein [Sphingorhabdus sp. EL138]|uniref:hypothetical protein n=1 Tax=Sphingorhabdus sp. EL138 TaxID=2073156 RepID=UPI000D68A394|nr:hypothetical protein [Sphingorhabdus sp. EL138]
MTDNSTKNTYIKAMYVFIIFICGIGNFAMHKAMMESDHPMITEARGSFSKLLGPYGSYILEFAMLAAALIFANMGMLSAVFFYGIYTLANCAGAYVLFSNKH